MKKFKILTLLVCFMAIGLFFITCNDNDDKGSVEKPDFNSPLRAIPVSANPNDPSAYTVLASYTDGVNNYYLIDGGYIQFTFLNTSIPPFLYNGIGEASKAVTDITENSIANSITETVSKSYTNQLDLSWSFKIGAEAGSDSFKLSAEFGYELRTSSSWTNERASTTSFEEVKTKGQQSVTSFTVGNNNEPAGWYRAALYGTTDVYFFITTNLDKTQVLDWEGIKCLRSDSIITSFEYTQDGHFDNSPVAPINLNWWTSDFANGLPCPIIIDGTSICDGCKLLKFACICNDSNRVSAGDIHSLFIHNDGALWSWGGGGEENYGQLGVGDTKVQKRPVQVSKGKTFKAVSAGGLHSLAIDNTGALWAWGRNRYGQLGIGNTTDSSDPREVRPGTKFTAISAGGTQGFSLAIDETGALWAWGRNNYGQLGDGTTTQRNSPVPIKPETKFKAVAAGPYHSLAIDETGALWAWGRNRYGQLGIGNTTDSSVPREIKPGTNFTAISAGGEDYGFSLAIDNKGALWAWGSNEYGKLGDGSTSQRNSPVQVNVSEGSKPVVFRVVSAGVDHSFAIDFDGNLWAWGSNEDGRLGNGSTTRSNIPVKLNTGTSYTAVNAYKHSMAICINGRVWAWGRGINYRLGNDSTANVSVPSVVPNFDLFKN